MKCKWPFSLQWKKDDDRPDHLNLGDWGEKKAEQFLKAEGFKVLARNLRISTKNKQDELDLVVRNDTSLVFVEVKTRASEGLTRAAAAVDNRKKKALRRAALAYLARLKETPTSYRFDIIEVIGTPEAAPPEIRHIKRAFKIHTR